jgi:hypothetical protein
MKKLLLLTLAAGALAGCAVRYDVVTARDTYTARGKPKLDANGFYTFKDTDGQTNRVHKGLVRSIAPHENSSANKNKADFFISASPR